MDLTIRQATVEDADGLVDIGRQTYIETFADFYPQTVMSKYLDKAFSVSQLENELKHTPVLAIGSRGPMRRLFKGKLGKRSNGDAGRVRARN